MRVLIPFLGSTGHFHPFVPLVRALEEAGHEAAFACPYETFGRVIEANGFRAFPAGFEWQQPDGTKWYEAGLLKLAEDLGRPITGQEQAAWMNEHFFAGKLAETMLPDLLALHGTWPFDLVVGDAGSHAGRVAAELFGKPFALGGFANFDTPDMRRRACGGPVARLRERAGLPPDPDMTAYWRYLVIAPTAPSLVAQGDFVAPTTHFVRPEPFDQSGNETLPGWFAGLPDRPTVYATLGTVASGFPHAPQIFHDIITALRNEPVNLVVTVGRRQDPARFDPAVPNVHVEQYIPQTLLLSRCDLVVTHGGFNTMISAISHGLPLLMLPIAADQFENAARIEAVGAGISIQPEQRTAEAIRLAARRLLTEPVWRENARRAQAEMEALPGHDYAVALLERLAVEKQPIIAHSTGGRVTERMTKGA